MSYRKITRRHLLRGLSTFGTVAVGLPLLDIMLDNNGVALAADGTPIPCRVGVWFWGNGVRPEHFFPDGAVENISARGTPGQVKDWDPSVREHTRPLADRGLTPYVSMVSGTTVQADPEQAHHDGKNAVLTGSYEWFEGSPERGYAGPVTPSFDQLAANAWEGETPFKSLVLGVQEGAANNEPGNSGHFTSSTGRNTYLTPEYSPLAVFERLFMNAPGTNNDPDAQRLLAARRSVLDAVMDDIQALDHDLGAKDKICLDQHLTAIRQLEQRLAGGGIPAGCEQPSPPNDYPTTGGRQNLRGRSESMSQMLAIALACDMTRAFSYQFSVFQTGHDFSQEPELNGSVPAVDPDGLLTEETSFHEAAHFEDFQDAVRVVTNFTFDNLARTLELLAAIPEGDGTVLSNCAILATSEHTEPMSHSTRDLPMIIAGNAGGRLAGGLWYHGNDEKVSKAGLTILRASGIQAARFGVPFENVEGPNSDPSATETFTALEVNS